jgi:hypothetical protein
MAAEESSAFDRAVADRCLVLEIAGRSWFVPLDTILAVPRVGETIRIAGGDTGKVSQVDYEFAPEPAPVRMAEEMPSDRSYARPVRIIVRVS